MRKSHAQMMKSIHFVFLFTSLLATTHAGRDHSSPQVISSKKLKKHKDSGSMITKDIYMNSWAVRVVGDNLMAQKVAVENGFMYKGKVYGDVYEFIHRGVPRRRKRASFIKTLRLGKDNRVRWTQQQASKRRVKRSIHFNDEKWPDQWYLHRTEPGYEGHDMNILPVWKRGITGKGVVVSILDDGIEHTHPELRDNYDKKASFDYNNNDTDPMPNYTWREDNTHGTRCAGEVAAKPNNTRCLVGVAYGARIGGIRMLDGEITDMIEAQSLRHNRDYIDIYSSSWGPEDDGRTVEGPGLLTEQTLAAGAKLGRKGRGSIFVWASGNGGKQMDYCNCDGYTNSIYTISVSAATAHGKQPWYLEHCASTLVSTYSSGKSRHDKHIVTADLKGGCTDSHTGTSVSPPMVAGVAALALEVNPKLTWRDVQHLLVETSSLKNLEDSDFQYNGVKKRFSHSYGFGLINADKMVTMAEKWPTIGEQHVCVKEKEVLYPQNRFNKSQPLVLHLNTTACHGTKQYIKYIEHVQLVASLFHYKRGATEISIQSPMGTISWVLRRRDRDDMPGNFNQWKFLSTHFWGEDPRGMWKVSFYSTGSSSGQGQGFAQEMKLRIYGTEEKPGEDTSKKIDSSLCHAECSSYCTGTENHECDSCKNLHYLDDSGTKHCVATCPAKMYLDNEKKQCLSCHNTCLKCSGRNETDCVTCYPDDVMLNGRCVKECPKGMFKTQDTHNKELHHCQFCFKRCTSCSGTSSNCSSCHKGSTLHGNQCAAACASDQWLDGNKCKLCHNSCKTCIGGMEFNCTSCSKKIFNDKYDRFLYKATSQCLATCPLGTYQSETLLKECLDCQDNCLRCSNNGQKCEICRMDHFLVADLRTCVETCPEGYYTDLLKRTCEPCDIQCKTCVVGNPSACTSCRESFFLKEQSCVSSHECRSLYYVNKKTGRCNFCPSNCTHCESQKSCTQCLLSYFLTPDNRCVSECPKGTFPVASQRCHRCHPSCTHCNGPSQYDCTLCPDDHSLLNGECLETQPSGHYVALYGGVSSYQQCHHYCAECDGPTYGNCTKCIGKLDMRDKKCVNPCPGQWLSDNSCETCHPTCLSCSGPSSRNCLQCNSGYLLNIVTRQCTKNCHRKYYKDMKTQTCRPCHHSCGTCFGANPDQCITCPPKLRFFNNTCLNECPIGWYSQLAVSRVCRRCSPQCNSCQYNPTLCTGCGSNRVWHDFKCFDSCEKGMFQDSNNKRCYRCHESCLTCNGTAPNECLICAEGMTLDKGICVEGCLIGQYNSSLDGGNCKACPKDCIQCHEHGDTKEPKCTICSRTTSLQLDGSCSPQCSPGTYRLPYDNICKSCSINNCLECPLGKKCTKCKTLYKPTTSGHQCESACEEGTYQDLTEQKCADCHHLCLTCNGPTKHGCPICRKKALTLIKRDKQTSCVLECPVGYYQQERHCLPCDGKCKTCETESEQCLSCNEPYILERTNCIAECSEAYYRDLKANQCIPCSTNCSECSPDGCSKCKPGANFLGDVCVSECGPGFYAFEQKCVSCSDVFEQCYTCTKERCLGCEKGFELTNDNQTCFIMTTTTSTTTTTTPTITMTTTTPLKTTTTQTTTINPTTTQTTVTSQITNTRDNLTTTPFTEHNKLNTTLTTTNASGESSTNSSAQTKQPNELPTKTTFFSTTEVQQSVPSSDAPTSVEKEAQHDFISGVIDDEDTDNGSTFLSSSSELYSILKQVGLKSKIKKPIELTDQDLTLKIESETDSKIGETTSEMDIKIGETAFETDTEIEEKISEMNSKIGEIGGIGKQIPKTNTDIGETMTETDSEIGDKVIEDAVTDNIFPIKKSPKTMERVTDDVLLGGKTSNNKNKTLTVKNIPKLLTVDPDIQPKMKKRSRRSLETDFNEPTHKQYSQGTLTLAIVCALLIAGCLVFVVRRASSRKIDRNKDLPN